MKNKLVVTMYKNNSGFSHKLKVSTFNKSHCLTENKSI